MHARRVPSPSRALAARTKSLRAAPRLQSTRGLHISVPLLPEAQAAACCLPGPATRLPLAELTTAAEQEVCVL